MIQFFKSTRNPAQIHSIRKEIMYRQIVGIELLNHTATRSNTVKIPSFASSCKKLSEQLFDFQTSSSGVSKDIPRP